MENNESKNKVSRIVVLLFGVAIGLILSGIIQVLVNVFK